MSKYFYMRDIYEICVPCGFFCGLFGRRERPDLLLFAVISVGVSIFVLFLSLMFFSCNCTVYVWLFAVLLCQPTGTALGLPAMFKNHLLCCIM